MSGSKDGYLGAETVQNGASEFNAVDFMIKQLIKRVATATLVKVVKSTSSGSIAKGGRVDILPLVNQIDGFGNPTPHSTVYNIPYVRMQAGGSAIILDPVAGDIGIAIFCSHDISAVKSTGGQANPGSFRRFSMADAIYIGGVLNAIPTQYVAFSNSGIVIKTPGNLRLDAATIDIVASGAVTIQSASLTHNGKNIGASHTHGGVQTGGGNTGVPNP